MYIELDGDLSSNADALVEDEELFRYKLVMQSHEC